MVPPDQNIVLVPGSGLFQDRASPVSALSDQAIPATERVIAKEARWPKSHTMYHVDLYR
jgi:hypothetical protein